MHTRDSPGVDPYGLYKGGVTMQDLSGQNAVMRENFGSLSVDLQYPLVPYRVCISSVFSTKLFAVIRPTYALYLLWISVFGLFKHNWTKGFCEKTIGRTMRMFDWF